MALAALPLLAGASAEPKAAIDLSISGLRSDKGQVLICLTARAEHFPDCRDDEQARRMIVDTAAAGTVRIADVMPGTYALALVHDENRNGKLDTALFMPREGFGFSRNPKIAMGPPKFGSAKFTVGAGPVAQPVRMKYMF